jgi:regulator of CtrA degradation
MDAGNTGGDANGERPSPVRPFRFDALHAEALELALAARAYVAAQAASPPEGDGDVLARLAACETTRLVSRVGFCLAWLLARRAAAAGEPEPEGADAEGWRLGGREVCLAGSAARPGTLPLPLAERSARLYARVDRLDRQLAGEDPPPRPAAVASPSAAT